MNGAGHYREAESLLVRAEIEPEASILTPYFTAAAQVHATLALAAAQIETAYAVATKGEDGAIRTDWVEATE